MKSSIAALPRAIVRVKRIWPDSRLVLQRVKQAMIAFAIAAAVLAAGYVFYLMSMDIKRSSGERIRQQYAIRVEECVRRGGNATRLIQPLRDDFQVECWEGSRLIYVSEFPHPFDE